MDLYEVLFSARGPEEGPLFQSQTDLAEAIKAIPDGGFSNPDRSVDSVRAFINQVLNRHRPLSANLRKAILAAAKKRNRLDISEDELVDQLQRAFLLLQDPTSAAEMPLDDREEFEALEAAANKAKVQYIFTYQPAESTDSAKALRLRNTLAENLGLTTNSSPSSRSSKVQYIFHVHRKAEAFHFWRKLQEYLVNLKVVNVAERLMAADADLQPRLSIYVTDAFLCTIPHVVFDPDSPQATGFVLFYHGHNRVSVARMSPDGLAQWTQEIYRPLINGVEVRDCLKFRRERVRFKDTLTPNS